MWEDPANCNGGKFVVRSKKRKVADRYWEEMILAIIGEQFEHSEDICGVVISSRSTGDDVLSLWNRTATDESIVNSIREKIKQVLGLPASLTVEYKAHNQSIAETLNAANQAASTTAPGAAPAPAPAATAITPATTTQ
jgi:translation initiation factor 4E